jgi:hypothetical protein
MDLMEFEINTIQIQYMKLVISYCFVLFPSAHMDIYMVHILDAAQ